MGLACPRGLDVRDHSRRTPAVRVPAHRDTVRTPVAPTPVALVLADQDKAVRIPATRTPVARVRPAMAVTFPVDRAAAPGRDSTVRRSRASPRPAVPDSLDRRVPDPLAHDRGGRLSGVMTEDMM